MIKKILVIILALGLIVALLLPTLPVRADEPESLDKTSLDEIIWDERAASKTAELTSEGSGFWSNQMPFIVVLENNLLYEHPLRYHEGGKYISFDPADIRWVTSSKTILVRPDFSQLTADSIGSLLDGKVSYSDAFGSNINIENSVSNTNWRKEVTIESLSALGAIPYDAEFLEIAFELRTDFGIEGWDKKTELQFNTAIKLSELSQLESIKTWDNHVSPKPKEGEEPEDPFLRCDGFLRVVEGRYYLVKRIPVEYLKQATYPVITDTVITYGAEYTFNVGDTLYVSNAVLDDTHFVVGYRDNGGDGYGHVKIGVVTGDAIAYGAEYTFNAASTNYISVAALDATHFVVAYQDQGDGSYGKAVIGVVSSGDVVTFGAEYTFSAAYTGYVSSAALDATHFVVAYNSPDPSRGRAIIGVVTGDAIAYGAEVVFEADNISRIYSAALDATHFVVIYRDISPGEGRSRIGVVSSGDVITFGAIATFSGSDVGNISVAALDATHFVVARRRSDLSPFKGYAVIGVVSSGDVITYGSSYEFADDSCGSTSSARLDDTHFVVGYGWEINSIGKSRIGVVTGDAIAFGSAYGFNAATVQYVSFAALDAYHFVAAYQDSGGDDGGQAKIGSIPEPVVAPTVTTQAASNVQAATATGNGNITDTGGEDCDLRGIVWDLASHGNPGNVSPAVSDYANDVAEGGSFGTGAFTRSLTGLPTGDTIYARAYAHNSEGYAYGAEVNFLTKPAAPTNVSATDNTYTDLVRITWTKSTGATGYRVYEGSNNIGGLLGDVATYDDSAAPAGTISNAGTVTASDGAQPDYVILSLAGEATTQGASRTYKVVAVNGTGNSDDSSTDTGYRGVAAITYQWQMSDADSDAGYNTNVGTTDPRNATEAIAGIVTPGTGSASDGASEDHVVLSLAGESVAEGAGRYFQCVVSATGASNSPQISNSDRGYRTTGSLNYQWQRSAGDSNGSFGAIGGATTDPYNDTGAPADGSGRWYYAEVGASGTTTQYSTHDRGYRLGPPSVTTNAASSVEETTGILNGEITATGHINAITRGFEWDTDSGAPYANDWHADGDFGVDSFTRALISLTEGELYYYRVYATNSVGTTYGSEVTFLTKPDGPNTFVATVASGTQIDFTWVKGTGAQKTYIRGKDGSYPDDRSDGYLVYNDTGTAASDSGLTGEHTYYYKAWSYATEGAKEQYSDLYGSAFALPPSNLVLWIQPVTIISGTTLPDRAGTAQDGTITYGGRFSDSGTTTTLVDSELTQADDYWNGYTLKIKETTDGNAPEGESSTITDFTAATLGGTADSGSTTTIVDATLTQSTAYWAGVTVTIVTTTDGEAPQGESKTVTTWDLPTNTLTFPAMTAAVEADDTYSLTAADTLWFSALTVAPESGDRYEIWDGQVILWADFPEGITVEIGSLTAYTDPVSSATGLDAPEVARTPQEPGGLWGGSASVDLPLYPLFSRVADDLGWTPDVLYVTASFIVAIGMGLALLITTGSVLGAVAGVGVGMVGGMAIGVLPVWILVVYLILAGTWLYTSRSM